MINKGPLFKIYGLVCLSVFLSCTQTDQSPKKIVLLAGKKSHGPGDHEYVKDLRLVKHCLETSSNAGNMQIELHTNGWPENPATLDDADVIVLFSDGANHDEKRHPFLVGDRLKVIEKQMQRGCGLVLQHYATLMPRRLEDKLFDWVGGYFDYESGPAPKNWYSQIQWATTTPILTAPQHPISRGIRPFELHDEYYINIRFPENAPDWTPLLSITVPEQDSSLVVAWAVERENGGRGFATTCGHSHENFELSDYRKLHLNAIVWAAGLDVPAGGVISSPPPDWQPKESASTLDPNHENVQDPLRALIVTGHHHPGHPWQESTPVLRKTLWQDPRFLIDTIHDPDKMEFLDMPAYDVMVLNYCNWKRPGLSTGAKDAFVNYVKQGGGLVIVHFSNGAFHFSLPETGESDWPEYRNICRRVWDHSSDSAHDKYGPFTVNITDHDHPITKNMQDFRTIDELYFNQKGNQPIHVLATARSNKTGKEEPMAWVYTYGKGRVFQTVLGHSAESLDTQGTSQLVLNGATWAAGLFGERERE